MKWVTRARPKIDRLACPWLITRFLDPAPEFLFVPPGEVLAEAARGATPYDVPGVELSHVGERCSFDAFLARYRLEQEPGLLRLARIVRGADTARPELAPECAGLLAISLGLGRVFADDHALLAATLPLYDGLHAWCRSEVEERHSWPPAP